MAVPPAAAAETDATAPRSLFYGIRYQNNMYFIPVPSSDISVLEFKRLLAQHPEIRVPTAQQQVIRSGTLLHDHQRLSEFQMMQNTALHLVPTRVSGDHAPAGPANTEGNLPWARPQYGALPLVRHDLPIIEGDVFETAKFLVWCTACTAPCFPRQTDAAAATTTTATQQHYQRGEAHLPRCTTEAECLALSRHVPIGSDSHGVPYPQELQPASAQPRCRLCKTESVLVDGAISWEQVFSQSVQGECLACGNSGRIIEVMFRCRGELARNVSFDSESRSVCHSLSVERANVILPNVHQQAPREILDYVALVAELVRDRARAAITAATATPVNLTVVQEAAEAATDASRSVETGPAEAVARAVLASKNGATKLEALLHALQANNGQALPATHRAVEELARAADECYAAAAAARAPSVDSSDSGSPDSIQLEFHGCTAAGKPHRLNANGLEAYMAAQDSLRSVMVRNDRIPHIFGSYVIRCCQPGCGGILYLPSCRVAGGERYEVIRDWATTEVTLQQGGVLCPLPNHQGDPAYLPPRNEAGPCRACPTCREHFCEQHQTAWRSCLHNMDIEATARHLIDKALAEGAIQVCPKCRVWTVRENATCTAMTCSICNARWCYFCAREVDNHREHSRDWETNATRCPRFLDDHPHLAGAPIQAVAHFHRLKTLRLLRQARRALEKREAGRFDQVFAAMDPSSFVIETTGPDGSGQISSATAPPITIEDVRGAQEEGLPYAMP